MNYGQIPAGSGLIGGYWAYNSSNLADISGNGRTMTAYGSPTYVDAKFGKGMNSGADGTGAYIANSCGYVGGSFTTSFWYKPSSTTDAKVISNLARNFSASDTSGYIIYYTYSTGVFRFIKLGGTGFDVSAASVGANNTAWHHVCGTYQSNGASSWIKLYVDSNLMASFKGTHANNWWTGAVQERLCIGFAAWNPALSAQGSGPGTYDEFIFSGTTYWTHDQIKRYYSQAIGRLAPRLI